MGRNLEAKFCYGENIGGFTFLNENMVKFKKLQEEHEIYSTIRDKIIFVEYESGYSLKEQQLAEEFGCSRAMIREALLLLRVEGLVTSVPNKGSFVSYFDLTALKNNFMIRINLVKPLGKLAAENISDEQINELENILANLEEERKDLKLIRMEYQFHCVLHAAADNAWLSGILEVLLGHAVRGWIANPSLRKNYGTPFVLSNLRELIEALKNRDAKKSSELLVDHVKFQLESLGKFVEGMQAL